MRPLPFLLILLFSAQPILSKHGGSGGGGGGSSSNGDSGSSSSDSGGSDDSGSSSSGPTAEDCDDAAKYQDSVIASPVGGSHYNGTLKVRHNIIAQETTATDYNAVCQPEQLGTKAYEYPEAYLYVGPKISANDTNDLYWELTAYLPFESWSGYGTQDGAKRQIVYLRSMDMTDSRSTMQANGTFTKPESQLRTCWNVEETRRTEGTGNETVDQWDVETKFVRVSQYSGASRSELYPDRTGNFISIVDICLNNGFEVSPPGYVKVPSFNGRAMGTAFMDTGANATIRNVGGDTVSFKMDNGLIDQGIFGAADWKTACESTGSQYADLEAFQRSSVSDFWNLNLTVELSLEFEGALWKENSYTFVANASNSTTGKVAPLWTSGSEGRWVLGNDIERTVFAVLFGTVVWIVT